MRQQKTTSAPSNFLFFDTETKGEIDHDDMATARHYLWFGICQAFRFEGGKQTREVVSLFKTIPQFWKCLKARLDPSRPLYVFAHNIGFDLTIVDFWRTVESEEWQREQAVMDDPPTFFILRIDDCKVYFIDTLNYWRCSLADLGESLGIPKGKFPAYDDPFDKWVKYCQQDVRILADAITELITYLEENDLGRFALTAPSIAMNVFKHKFMKHEIYIHDNIHALDLERSSYYGGLVNCFYIGCVDDTIIYDLDVNSLYPSVMLGDFPCRYMGLEKTITPTRLLAKLQTMGACAYVDIDSEKATYPWRQHGKLLEVTGTYSTYLCGAELEEALDKGYVKRVHLAAMYELAPLFEDFVAYFWGQRKHYKDKGNTVKQTFCKLLMNSLYGKFGQKGFEWVEVNPYTIKILYSGYNLSPPKAYLKEGFAPNIHWQQSKWFARDLPDPITVRSLGGVTEMKVAGQEHHSSFPAIAGFVTAYARVKLRRLMEIANIKNIYYCDTDSLFVNSAGYKRLEKAGEINPGELGKLKVVTKEDYAEFYGPKDYLFGDKEVIKGIREKAIEIGPGEYMQNSFEGLKSVLKRDPEPYIKISWIVKRNRREYKKGLVGEDGRVTPFVLSDNQIATLF